MENDLKILEVLGANLRYARQSGGFPSLGIGIPCMGVLSKRRSRRSAADMSSSSASSSTTNSTMMSFLFNHKVLVSLAITSFLSLATLLYANSPFWVFSHSSIFYSFEVVSEFPHDPSAFTQGPVYAGNDILYESTGVYGEVQHIHHMHREYFGEGLTLLGERLLQLAWKIQTGFIYDRHNLSQLATFTHHMKDGWGLATDGKVIFGSDGTSTLYKLDPNTLRGMGETTVKYNDIEVYNLNELEYVNGEIWANVWMSDCVARISPKTGAVLGWILLHKLRQNLYSSGYNGFDVLNGIAWDGKQNRVFVTGKLWPKLYEIKLHPLTQDYKNIVELCQLRRAGRWI